MNITIHGENKSNSILINNLLDLQKLPDKTIRVLFDNSNYIVTIYLYTLSRLDLSLEEKRFTLEKRTEYFNKCIKLVPELIKHQEKFLSGSTFSSIKIFESVPKEIIFPFKSSLTYVCTFFSGILSATPYLDSNLFPKKEINIFKHNYANIIQILLDI